MSKTLPAEIIIGIDTQFDRASCERLNDGFRHKAWACPVAEVF